MICPTYQSNATFFIFSSASFIPRILYYSHIPAMFLSLFMGFFVYFKSGKTLVSKIFLAITISFFSWALLDIIAWTNSNSNILMFIWPFFSLLFVLLYTSFLYFFEVFFTGKDISFRKKLILGLSALPIILLSPTKYYLDSFNLSICGANERNFSAWYCYFIGLVVVIWIIISTIKKYYQEKDYSLRKQILILSISANLFLVSFLASSSIATFLVYNGFEDDYFLEPYGLFGMPIFIASVVYLMSKYKLFNIKLHESQTLIIGLLILVASQLFYIKNSTDRILTIITLAITVIFGLKLIRSIKEEEIRKRKELEKINEELMKLDQAKSDFINLASHQLRTPVTIIKGVTSLIISGKMERFSKKEKEQFYHSIWTKSRKMEEVIKDILNAASLTNKKYLVPQASTEEIDFQKLISSVVDDFQLESEEKGIELVFSKKGEGQFLVNGIKEDLREVLNNLVNNAFKYTPTTENRHGRIEISLGKKNDTILISIKDNGIGIDKEEISKLFQKFYRASNAKAVYTDGSGLGLFIVKEIVEGHGGKITVESELGKGTLFLVFLPASKE